MGFINERPITETMDVILANDPTRTRGRPPEHGVRLWEQDFQYSLRAKIGPDDERIAIATQISDIKICKLLGIQN